MAASLATDTKEFLFLLPPYSSTEGRARYCVAAGVEWGTDAGWPGKLKSDSLSLTFEQSSGLPWTRQQLSFPGSTTCNDGRVGKSGG